MSHLLTDVEGRHLDRHKYRCIVLKLFSFSYKKKTEQFVVVHSSFSDFSLLSPLEAWVLEINDRVGWLTCRVTTGSCWLFWPLLQTKWPQQTSQLASFACHHPQQMCPWCWAWQMRWGKIFVTERFFADQSEWFINHNWTILFGARGESKKRKQTRASDQIVFNENYLVCSLHTPTTTHQH